MYENCNFKKKLYKLKIYAKAALLFKPQLKYVRAERKLGRVYSITSNYLHANFISALPYARVCL